jgi:predicted transcriptional regulator
MAASNILTVRMNEDELIKLDELAKLQNRPRSQLVQDAVKELIRSSDELKQREFLRIKARLAPAVKAQCALLDMSSVADEHRRF